MEQVRLAPLAGIVAAILVLVVLAVPYLLVPEAGAVGTYYGTGAITPLITGLFAVLSIVVFAAGRQERTDPALAAGAVLVMGAFGFVIALVWALTVPLDVVTGMGTNELLAEHRWALTLVAVAIPTAAGWYAHTMRLI